MRLRIRRANTDLTFYPDSDSLTVLIKPFCCSQRLLAISTATPVCDDYNIPYQMCQKQPIMLYRLYLRDLLNCDSGYDKIRSVEGDCMNLVYSYRLTNFSGTAPCMDNDSLTLAICKRDMRRVIGRQFIRGTDDTIWFMGIVGSGLAKYSSFRERKGDFLYLAKLTDVVSFEEYFSNTAVHRADKIYFPCKDGEYGNIQKFSPKPENGVHESADLWDKDWDIKHGMKECYVLCSDSFCVLTKEQSERIKSLCPQNASFPERQGHRSFTVGDNSEFITYLNELVDRNKNPLLNQQIQQLRCKSSCGKVKAV